MSLVIGIGFSSSVDSYTVGVNSCQEALSQLKDSNPLFGLIFVSGEYDHRKIINGISSVLKGVPLAGTSAAGLIYEGGIITGKGVLIVLFEGSNILVSSHADVLDTSSGYRLGEEAGKRVVRELGGKPDVSFVFTDVLSGAQQHKILKGLSETTTSPIFGGGSADLMEFKKTFQYLENKVTFGSIAFSCLKGDIKCGLSMDHGLSPVGTPQFVTKSKGVKVLKINDRPAVSLYEKYFGYKDLQEYTTKPIGKLSASYPLGFRKKIYEQELIVRSSLFLKSDGSFVCSDSIPENSIVQIMMGDRDEALEGVLKVTQKALAMLGEKESPKIAIISSGAGRRYFYGGDAEDEVREVQRALGSTVPVVGFFSYGSICSLGVEKEDESVFQDNSISICLLK